MTRLAAVVVLLTLGLVALVWHALEVLDALLGGDDRPTVGLTPTPCRASYSHVDGCSADCPLYAEILPW